MSDDKGALIGIGLLAQSIEWGLAKLGRDETEMMVKRQDVEDIRSALSTIADLESALVAEQERNRNNVLSLSERVAELERENERLREIVEGRPVIKSEWEQLIAERDQLRVRVADQDAQIEALIAHLAECKAREAKLREALEGIQGRMVGLAAAGIPGAKWALEACAKALDPAPKEGGSDRG